LKSTDESERLGSVSLLARMFSEKESSLAVHHIPLWQAFIGRFNDVSVGIRIKCVQYSMHFLLNHLELRDDIVEALKVKINIYLYLISLNLKLLQILYWFYIAPST
jgi:sister-chromatid-cohesion protein PDS5